MLQLETHNVNKDCIPFKKQEILFVRKSSLINALLQWWCWIRYFPFFLFFLSENVKDFNATLVHSSIVPRHFHAIELTWTHKGSAQMFYNKVWKKTLDQTGKSILSQSRYFKFSKFQPWWEPVSSSQIQDKMCGYILLVARKLTLCQLWYTLKPLHHHMLWLVPSTKSWHSWANQLQQNHLTISLSSKHLKNWLLAKVYLQSVNIFFQKITIQNLI